MRNKITSVFLAILLSGCAYSSQEEIASIEAAYATAANAEIIYLSSPYRNPDIASQMKEYDEAAYVALIPLRNAAQNKNGNLSLAEIQAAQNAVTTLTQYVTNQTKTVNH